MIRTPVVHIFKSIIKKYNYLNPNSSSTHFLVYDFPVPPTPLWFSSPPFPIIIAQFLITIEVKSITTLMRNIKIKLNQDKDTF